MPSPNGAAATRNTRPRTSNNGITKAGRERVAEIQRTRLIAAMVEIAGEQGLAEATVARVVARAGVSRRTFYELFEDREECFLAAFDAAVAQASRYAHDAYDPEARWAERIRAAVTGLLSFLDIERGLGRLLLVGSLGAGPAALDRRRRVLGQMVSFVDEGHVAARAGSEPTPLTAEGIVGGALSVVHTRLVGDGQGRLVELVNPLMSMIVLPYLGPAAARGELERPVPKSRAVAVRGEGDPLRDLGMRLTYRTVRVLLSIAAAPGSSNREVGMASGIPDQGQMSKLLGRLEGLGLVRNRGLAPGKGAPNAWTLTGKGTEVERAMSADVGSREPAISVAANVRSGR
jgi:AcrR family transcriptional regulator